jgi:predicted site-specific integrase-resolvase
MRDTNLKQGVKNMELIKGEFLTRADLCRLFKITLPTVLRWEKAGRLHPVHIGPGSVRHKRTDIETLIGTAQ